MSHLLAFACRLVAITTVVTMSGCGLQAGLDQRSDSGSSPTKAPAIDGTTISGARLSWSSLQGHPVVIDFWASWCGPCRAEQQDVNALVSRYAAKGVRFIGVDMRDDTAAALAYRRDLGVAYDSVPDSSEQISASFNVSAPPTVIVVDQHGRIVDRFLGTIVGVSDELNRLG